MSRSAPKGKLRVVHEAAPMAWLAEQAGAVGVTSAGVSLLDVTAIHVRECTPLVIGSKDDVADYLAFVCGEENEGAGATAAAAAAAFKV